MKTERFLAIDAGNTNIVLGLYEDDVLMHQWRVHTDRKKLADEYADLIESLLQKQDLKPQQIDVIGVSNVVPSLGSLIEDMIREHFGREAFFVRHDNRMNFEIVIDSPRDLGADLIAACAAAVENYEAPCIIIDFGTATTITAVNDRFQFLGGAIAPGLAVSCEALYTYAPHLPRIRLQSPPSVIATNTPHAMQAGIFTGYIHLIRGLVDDMKSQMGGQAKVIATGGLASVFNKGTNILDVLDPHLVLDGIKILYRLNQ